MQYVALLLALAALPGSARGDAATKLTHVVHLCSEDHREALGAEWPAAHHITNLKSVRALIVSATKDEVAALNRDSRVCAVNAAQPVSHHPSTPSQRQLNSVSWGNFVGADKHALQGKANRWYEDSHHEGKPWNLDRINGKLDGDDDTENNGKGVNIFVLDTGLDTTHPEFKGDSREVENVGRFDGQGENWKSKKEWGWDDKPTDKDSNDFDGHGAFAVYEPL
jgi:subtilisin family serine protease